LSFLARNPCGKNIGLAIDFLKATDDLVPITWQEFFSQIFGSPSEFHATETWLPKGAIEFDKDFFYFAESDRFDGLHLLKTKNNLNIILFLQISFVDVLSMEEEEDEKFYHVTS
jgi:hypothetical protein